LVVNTLREKTIGPIFKNQAVLTLSRNIGYKLPTIYAV